MKLLPSSLASAAALIAAASLSPSAGAATYPVMFNSLNASATVGTPLVIGDTLFVDTLVTMETNPLSQALSQSVTFTLASNAVVSGFGTWEVSTAGGTAPRLTGVDINLLNAGGTTLVSDGAATVTNGFASSSIADTFLTAGTYRLTAVGTAAAPRATVLDISLTVAAVPEPETYALMLAGLAAVGFVARRRAAQG